MSDSREIRAEEVDALYQRLLTGGKQAGYNLNPDVDFAGDLIEGLILNQKRYGYLACPCRLASGKKAEDMDIICPCDYRDPDLTEYGACYCALYVSKAVVKGEKKPASIPERRPPLYQGAIKSATRRRQGADAGVHHSTSRRATRRQQRCANEGDLVSDERAQAQAGAPPGSVKSLAYPVWRCTVCGYLCARESPPEVCPICAAERERFERFM
jgi:ferredoxin-thioredoxin reductase catalytic subunit